MKKPVIFYIIIVLITTISFVQLRAQTNVILWQKNGGITASTFSTVDRITFSSGNFLVKKTDNSISSYLINDIKYMTFGQFSDVKDLSQNTDIIIYPNPATNYIKIKNTVQETIKIEIYNLDGRKVLSLETIENQQIDISELEKGLYIAKINTKTYKFTKQ